jgi:DNA-binding NarL/FixJ family response regulator
MQSGEQALLEIRCTQPRAMHEALRLLIAAAAPDVHVLVVADAGQESPAIAVHLPSANRWMCVMREEHDVAAARWALANGAWCLASLEGNIEQFQSATHALISGNPHYLPVSFARLIASGEHRPAGPATPEPEVQVGHTPLTAREREVLRCVAEGLSNAEIAERLSISVHTVRTHLSSMATKIDAGNRLKLVAKATQLGYPEADRSIG